MLSRIHSEVLSLTEQHPNRRFASEGVRRVKPGYTVTLWATYSSHSIDSDWNLSLEDPEIFEATLSEPDRTTIHKLSWEHFKGITIEVNHDRIRKEK